MNATMNSIAQTRVSTLKLEVEKGILKVKYYNNDTVFLDENS